jgi:hypothetical protein
MASKKTETDAGPAYVKKRYLSADQCKASAARISAEMREDREGREKWGDQWAAYVPIGHKVYTRGKKPLHLVIPGDFDQAAAVINHLYHPEEAALIIGALTP